MVPPMQLARVLGTVVATRKYEGLDGVKLLLIQPLDHKQAAVGEPIVAADTVRAGPRELVYWVASREAALALGGKVRKLALYEPPYNDDPAAMQGWRDFRAQLAATLAAARPTRSVFSSKWSLYLAA